MEIDHSLEKAVQKHLRKTKGDEEAIRLSLKIPRSVQQILDDYQIRDRDALVRFIIYKLNSPELALEEVPITDHSVEGLIYGIIRVQLRDDLRRIYWYMNTMCEATEANRKEAIIGHVSRKKYFLPNRESLHDLIVRALKEFCDLGKLESVSSIEAVLKDQSKVKRPSVLVKSVVKEYGFASSGHLYGFLTDVADTPTSGYRLEDMTGSHKIPSNYHRKLFAVAAILDYATQNGLKDKAIAAILQRGGKRSLKEGVYVDYLMVKRSRYKVLLNKIEEKGITGKVLGSILSKLFGITMDVAMHDYVTRNNHCMWLDHYNRLEEFTDKLLPLIGFVDLRNPKTRKKVYDKFMKTYRGGRVLVKTGLIVDPRGKIVKNYVPFLQGISTHVNNTGGRAYLSPSYSQVVPEITGFFHYKDLLAQTIFNTLTSINKINPPH